MGMWRTSGRIFAWLAIASTMSATRSSRLVVRVKYAGPIRTRGHSNVQVRQITVVNAGPVVPTVAYDPNQAIYGGFQQIPMIPLAPP